MKTVLYFEFVRNGKKYRNTMVYQLIAFFILFLIAVIMDRIFPQFNVQYMRWPDMVKNLLGLSPWNRSLYVNIWQLVALFYPLYFVYHVMAGLVTSVREEDRLETIVYLNNLSVSRGNVLAAKGLIWLLQSFIVCLSLGIENTVFFICLGMNRMVNMVIQYYIILFFVSLLFLGIAVFILSCSRNETRCRSGISWLLGITFVLARVYALIQFLADLLIATERSGVLADTLTLTAEKMQVLSILSPVVWCWPSCEWDVRFVWCGVLIFLICVLAGWSIYTHEKVMNDNE